MYSIEHVPSELPATDVRRHRADRPVGGVQYCERCGGVLVDWRRVRARRIWLRPRTEVMVTRGQIVAMVDGFDDLIPMCTADVPSVQ